MEATLVSNEIFPVLPGLTWNIEREHEWRNAVRESDSGRSFSRAMWTYPVRHYKLEYEFLRSGAQAELQALMGFFDRHKGDYDTWLFDDPLDNATSAITQFGTTDGVTQTFQLQRTFGNASWPVFDIKGTPVIYVDGVATTAFTVNSTGLVTTSSVLAAGKVMGWTGGWYWRCRFKAGRLAYKQFMDQLFSAKSVEFKTYKP
jgi:uncharacterized protein (TIGR02217 family)